MGFAALISGASMAPPGRPPDWDPLPQSRLRQKVGDWGCPLLDGQCHWDYLSSTACGAGTTGGEKYHDFARRRS